MWRVLAPVSRPSSPPQLILDRLYSPSEAYHPQVCVRISTSLPPSITFLPFFVILFCYLVVHLPY